jgi:hypothetical protein
MLPWTMLQSLSIIASYTCCDLTDYVTNIAERKFLGGILSPGELTGRQMLNQFEPLLLYGPRQSPSKTYDVELVTAAMGDSSIR